MEHTEEIIEEVKLEDTEHVTTINGSDNLDVSWVPKNWKRLIYKDNLLIAKFCLSGYKDFCKEMLNKFVKYWECN